MKENAISPRVRLILLVVDELQLDPQEIQALCKELDVRKGRSVDLSAGRVDADRAFVLLAKRYMNSVERGQLKMAIVGERLKMLREGIRLIKLKQQSKRSAG